MKKVALCSVYAIDEAVSDMFARVLYELLVERKPDENISHKDMPTWEEHKEFIASKPYKAWYVIQSLEEKARPFVGAIYLTWSNEIGIGILDIFKRQHYASAAIHAVMEEHPEKFYYANINPDNHKSKDLFKRLGFKYYRCLMGHHAVTKKYQIVQETYRFIS